jgi:hypothetical protein
MDRLRSLLARPIVARRAPRARLGSLERLETRDCPAAPVLSMRGHPADGGMLTITGRVHDEHPATTVVHLTGAVQGDAHPDATGYYRVLLPQTNSGAVTAQAVDDEGLWSDPVTDSDFTDNQPPTVILYLAQQQGHSVLLDGWVDDDDGSVDGLPVTLSGVACGSTTTNANGYFRITLTASALGAIGATAMDDEGDMSDTYWRQLTNIKPEILNFHATQVVGGYVISGTVNDEWAPGTIVTLQSSVRALDGMQLTVQSNGTFSTLYNPGKGFLGCSIVATVKDGWGSISDPAMCSIFI